MQPDFLFMEKPGPVVPIASGFFRGKIKRPRRDAIEAVLFFTFVQGLSPYGRNHPYDLALKVSRKTRSIRRIGIAVPMKTGNVNANGLDAYAIEAISVWLRGQDLNL